MFDLLATAGRVADASLGFRREQPSARGGLDRASGRGDGRPAQPASRTGQGGRAGGNGRRAEGVVESMSHGSPASEDLVEPGVRRFVQEVSQSFAAQAGDRRADPCQRPATWPRRCASPGARAGRRWPTRGSSRYPRRLWPCAGAGLHARNGGRVDRSGADLHARRRLDPVQHRHPRPGDARVRRPVGPGRRRRRLFPFARGPLPHRAERGRRGHRLGPAPAGAPSAIDPAQARARRGFRGRQPGARRRRSC